MMVETAVKAGREFIEAQGVAVSTEVVLLAGRKILPCTNCDTCIRKGTYCVLRDDWLELVQPLINPVPDGVIFGSPVYFFNQNAIGRAYMERCTSLLKGLWDPTFPHKPPDFSASAGGAIAVGFDRHGGVEFTLTSILHWFLNMGFVTVGGFYIGGAGWSGIVENGNAREAIKSDRLGLASARLLGQKVAKTALFLKAGRQIWGGKLPDTSWRSITLLQGGESTEHKAGDRKSAEP